MTYVPYSIVSPSLFHVIHISGMLSLWSVDANVTQFEWVSHLTGTGQLGFIKQGHLRFLKGLLEWRPDDSLCAD